MAVEVGEPESVESTVDVGGPVTVANVKLKVPMADGVGVPMAVVVTVSVVLPLAVYVRASDAVTDGACPYWWCRCATSTATWCVCQ